MFKNYRSKEYALTSGLTLMLGIALILLYRLMPDAFLLAFAALTSSVLVKLRVVERKLDQIQTEAPLKPPGGG